MVNGSDLDNEGWEKLQGLDTRLIISVNAIEKGEEACILDPQIQKRLLDRLDKALQFQPEGILIDRLRFGGDCTDIRDEDISKAHQVCQFCQGKDRVDTLTEFGKQLSKYVNGRSKLGIFAVAFKDDEAPKLGQVLGVNYSKLGKVFDLFSPMLYHQMLQKPVTYISDYTKWISEKTGKPILPIIQIKNMPDDLEDNITEEEIAAAFNEAIKYPSEGICFFWWAHALEKNKTSIIGKLFCSH